MDAAGHMGPDARAGGPRMTDTREAPLVHGFV